MQQQPGHASTLSLDWNDPLGHCAGRTNCLCHFQPGEGTGAAASHTKTYAGPAATKDECVDLVRQLHPAANGGTFGRSDMASRAERAAESQRDALRAGDSRCFAEFGISLAGGGHCHPAAPSASSRCSNRGAEGDASRLTELSPAAAQA